MLKKQALDVFDNVIQQENLRQKQTQSIKSLVGRTLNEDKTLNRQISVNDSNKGSLTANQRLEAKAKLQKYKSSGYKTNADRFEEYHIPTPNNQEIKTGKTFYNNQRDMSKSLKKM